MTNLRKFRKHLPAIKWIVIPASILVMVMVAVLVAIPVLLPSKFVKQQIVQHISQLLGWSITFSGDPQVRFYPYLGISLSDVRIYKNGPSEPAIVYMEKMHGRLKLSSALLGQVEIASYTLIRPQIKLHIDKHSIANWHTGRGVLVKTLKAIANKDQSKTNNNKIAQSPKIPFYPIGKIIIKSGMLDYVNEEEKVSESLTDIDITLNWPELSSGLTMNGQTVWRGQISTIEFHLGKPMILASGGISETKIDFKNPVLNVQFIGSMNMLSKLYFGGTAIVNIPSAKGLISFLGISVRTGSMPGNIKIASTVTASKRKINFMDASLSIDGNQANGGGHIEIGKNLRPKIAGTLAFEKLDFTPYFHAFRDSNDQTGDSGNLAFFDILDFDVRLSAKNSFIGDIQLSNLAASATIIDGKGSFDIADSSVFGGTLSAIFKTSQESSGKRRFELNGTLRDFVLESASALIPDSRVKLTGTGVLNFNLKTRENQAYLLLRDMDGDISLSAREGLLSGLDLFQLLKTNQDKTSDIIVLNGSNHTKFDSLTAQMNISRGVARIRKLKLRNQQITNHTWGIADLYLGSLAMRGSVDVLDNSLLKLTDEEDGFQAGARSYFIGGTVHAPLITLNQPIINLPG